MQRSKHYGVRTKQIKNAFCNDEQTNRQNLIKSQQLNQYLIELIASNDSSLLNDISDRVRKYIHASWLVNSDDFKRLQNEFFN